METPSEKDAVLLGEGQFSLSKLQKNTPCKVWISLGKMRNSLEKAALNQETVDMSGGGQRGTIELDICLLQSRVLEVVSIVEKSEAELAKARMDDQKSNKALLDNPTTVLGPLDISPEGLAEGIVRTKLYFLQFLKETENIRYLFSWGSLPATWFMVLALVVFHLYESLALVVIIAMLMFMLALNQAGISLSKFEIGQRKDGTKGTELGDKMLRLSGERRFWKQLFQSLSLPTDAEMAKRSFRGDQMPFPSSISGPVTRTRGGTRTIKPLFGRWRNVRVALAASIRVVDILLAGIQRIQRTCHDLMSSLPVSAGIGLATTVMTLCSLRFIAAFLGVLFLVHLSPQGRKFFRIIHLVIKTNKTLLLVGELERVAHAE